MKITGPDLVATALLITFITLKLTGAIGWSWWWVLAPAWIPPVIAAFVILMVVVAPAFAAKVTRR